MHNAKHMLNSASGTSPYAIVTEAQHIASNLVRSEPSPPTTRVSADGLTIFYEEIMFSVPSWRAGLRQMMDDVIASQDLLIGEADSFTIPDFIPDDWGTERRGYSWLKNADFGVHPYALVKNLMADPSNVSVGEDGRLVPNFPKLEKLLSDIGQITWTLMFLCYMLPGQVGRSEEFVEHKISNSTRPRTILRSGLEIWLVIRRMKFENLVRKATFIPALVPPELRIQLERYLILIRPLERALATIVYGPSIVHIYNEYMWVVKGKMIGAAKFNKVFRRAMKKYCGVEIGIHDYRQVVVQISRTYLGREVDMEDELEWDVFAAQRGHTVQTARRIYAPEVGHLPSMSSEALLRFSAASKAWWSVTGFVPGESPIPPRVVRSGLGRRSGALGDTEVADVVEAAVKKGIASLEARLEEKMGAIVSNTMENVAHSLSRTVEGMIQRNGHTIA